MEFSYKFQPGRTDSFGEPVQVGPLTWVAWVRIEPNGMWYDSCGFTPQDAIWRNIARRIKEHLAVPSW